MTGRQLLQNELEKAVGEHRPPPSRTFDHIVAYTSSIVVVQGYITVGHVGCVWKVRAPQEFRTSTKFKELFLRLFKIFS